VNAGVDWVEYVRQSVTASLPAAALLVPQVHSLPPIARQASTVHVAVLEQATTIATKTPAKITSARVVLDGRIGPICT
jgi:hypothetical protein